MGLTADDVLNQKFTITKFRDGYDLDQVDDFLDGVVEEFRGFEGVKAGLQSKADELAAELESCTGKLASAESELQAALAKVASLESELAETKASLEAAGSAAESKVDEMQQPSLVPTLVTPPQQASQPVAETTQTPSNDAVKSSAILQLALELHDKYIKEGEEKKTELITAGEKAVQDMLQEANKQRAVEIANLNEQKNTLQEKVDELRSFESEYRTTLRSYIEAQLRNLEGGVSSSLGQDSN